jgi:glycosyltransferase involved in cell wall biosynthesis
MFKKMQITQKWRDSWVLEDSGKRVPKRFALYVGDINYNKNIPNLVKACKIANIPLVIAGKQAYSIEKMNLNHPELSHLKSVDWSGVIRVGFVPDEVLVELYNLATVYVQPSFYEGFGLPVLEAVACGTPLAVARSQCVVEVLGDDFTYCDPKDAQSMAKAILNPNRDKKLPRIYSWEKTRKETLKVYRNV